MHNQTQRKAKEKDLTPFHTLVSGPHSNLNFIPVIVRQPGLCVAENVQNCLSIILRKMGELLGLILA